MGSRLLSLQENEKVEDLLGRRCVVSIQLLSYEVRWVLGERIFSKSLTKTTVSCAEYIVAIEYNKHRICVGYKI